MNSNKLFLGVIIEDNTTTTFVEICHRYQISEELLNEMVDYGVLPKLSNNEQQASLDQKALRRMETAFRLHRDLEVNLAGVALVLDLLDDMKAMRKELDMLHKHF